MRKKLNAVKTYAVDIFTTEIFNKLEKGNELMNYLRIDPDQNLIDLPKNSVDLVTSNMSIHHYSDKEAMFTEIRRVLKPGGHFFFKEHDVVETDTELTKKLN